MTQLQAEAATVAGTAGRIPAAEKAALQAGDAVLRATIQVTRAATGKVETYELIGTADPSTKEF